MIYVRCMFYFFAEEAKNSVAIITKQKVMCH